MPQVEYPVIPGSLPSNTPYPSDPQELLNLFCNFMSVFLPESVQYVKGDTTPTVNQQSLVWFRTDSSGALKGIYVYSGGQWVAYSQLNVGDMVIVPNNTTITSPWAPTDGGTYNGFTTPTIPNDTPTTGYKYKVYVGHY